MTKDRIEQLRHEIKCATSNLWAQPVEPHHAEIDALCDLALSALPEVGLIDAGWLQRIYAGKRPGTSMAMYLDPSLPEGVVEIRDAMDGRVLGRIINIGDKPSPQKDSP